MTDQFRAMCAELVDAVEQTEATRQHGLPLRIVTERLDRARALLAEPEPEGAPLSLVTNCHISGPAPKPFTSWSDYFNHVQQSGVISGLKIEATLPTPEATND